jgi:SAM-dependent methyltransferase
MNPKQWNHGHFRDGSTPDFWNALSSSEDGLRASRVVPKASGRAARRCAVETDHLAAFIFKNLAPEDDILDVGCGAGEMYVRIPRGFRGTYTGIDFSQGMLNLFEKEKPVRGRRRLLCGELGVTPLPRESFTFVMSIGVYFYIHPSERGTFIEEISKTLKPGGLLVIDLINENYHFARIKGNELSLAELRTELENHAFEVREVAGFFTFSDLFVRPWLLWDSLEQLVRALGPFRWPRLMDRWGYRICVVARKAG